jgi:hypothetical protein
LNQQQEKLAATHLMGSQSHGSSTSSPAEHHRQQRPQVSTSAHTLAVETDFQ